MIKVGTSRADITPPVGMPHANWGSSTHQVAEGIDMPMYCYVTVSYTHLTLPTNREV